MRAKFRGNTLDIDNQTNKSNEFYGEWNFYTIEILQNSKDIYHLFPNLFQKVNQPFTDPSATPRIMNLDRHK